MRVAIWSPNYAPEPTGIPPLVTDAAEWLAARGHTVDVITAVPNYPSRRVHPAYRGVLWRSEVQNGVGIHRSWLRAKPERSFADKALYELTISTFALPNAIRFARRADAFVCVVPTLLAAAYAATVTAAFRKRFVLWVQDLVLAAAPSVGMGTAASRVVAAARCVEQAAVRSADTVVVCSPGFRDYLVDGGANGRQIEVIHNWADLDKIQPIAQNGNGAATRFLYAGNLGYTQGFQTLIDAAWIGGEALRIEVVGSGNAAEDVRRLAESVPNVTVREPVSRSDYPVLLGSADAHLVIQRRISAGANLPSKIASYMASGRPIVASIDSRTAAAELLRKSGGAILVEPESPFALAEAMGDLARDPKQRRELGRNGREFAERHLAKEPALARLEAAIFG
jgi:colanic acid biosynthesis glycosyl transferase WcaI